jgi:hypothetical protein
MGFSIKVVIEGKLATISNSAAGTPGSFRSPQYYIGRILASRLLAGLPSNSGTHARDRFKPAKELRTAMLYVLFGHAKSGARLVSTIFC